ncbi:leucyl/phenylalanyl-tRNA--protein transferase [Bowmanella dokdonensis]|uniref:Leucyl/phenylalanyl-tRNA--protein transferase n=1 Tax=Bowmanella dokdonensis TaxID=751969 RepID=A0A939IN83_9ALTE|nr:leucyl/phenylalanyl-tRNA--protein transferase [Bowmanella dokdonensis]MBN7824565.1 leucyl/phenylalanyl-tRNA--protein transferase [Bowmanella dokdonensis]
MHEQFYKLSDELIFPSPQLALTDPNGLLAFGGDLSVPRLLLAYRNGIFPWFSEGEPILWWSPDPRGILELHDFVCSRSLARLARSGRYRVSLNHSFDEVIQACATIPRGSQGTWITARMIQAYQTFHRSGHAHSVEVWDNDMLVGGLYGVSVGSVFCGESMFHRQSNTSKLALYFLVEHLKKHGFTFIDCQLQNPHLRSLGAREIPRKAFLQRLHQAVNTSPAADCWTVSLLSPALLNLPS